MDLSSVIIAVAGMAGTLGGSLLTQRRAERARRREIRLVRAHDEERENLALRRTCYTELNRDARQFTTALNRHLHILRERGTADDTDKAALDEAKAAFRDRYSEAQMIAPEHVLGPAQTVNRALSDVYGQVKRLERDEPEAGETLDSASRAQHAVWDLLRTLRTAMRRDLGVSSGED
ncbi:hypothetical protein J7W19_26415 [Streptomyces mobaraensis NBRC 13819 = DSM 40847]|uniref:hypothetical protein n=1 Tax=Streptomyces mobaraensis TaxID=35621 RepID=UPI0005926126|nr:hypothetical protein [Streptomyces mobaraensis]QTT76440.1 hypothetical protein J7W19_26415 [Streptomyces mobaraensis NBRC 13819 = DSM 40847]